MKQKYLCAAAVIILLAAAAAAVLHFIIREPAVCFSEKKAFHDEAFDLVLSGGLFGGKIYYTLNGDDPTLESSVYTEPVRIEEGLPKKATVVKAAVLRGGKLGRTYTQTYFTGAGAETLFDVMVVSLSADRSALYDRQTGILSNYEEMGENGEWDRPAYIEFYGPDGTPMLAQGTGIAVSGNASRSFAQKSIKLISGPMYDMEHPTFDCDFFDTDMAGNASGQSYNRLVLRNGGSDHEGTMVKWNVASRLAKEAGIVCAGARPGVLFLNGEYYGIIQLQEKYTAYNVSHAIGARKDDVERFGIIEVNSARFGGYYDRLHRDLNLPENREKLEQSVDMTDMLRHYAVNILMNNNDWPFNNYRSWRCADTSSSAYGDGRVRFFLYDLDDIYPDTRDENNLRIFDYLMEEPLEDATDTLTILMSSAVYRAQFINLVCDLEASVYEKEHVCRVIDEEAEKIRRSMELYYTEEQRLRQQEAVEVMKAEAAGSGNRVREGLEKYLGAQGPYTLHVETPEGIEAAFSQIHLKGGSSYTGVYYHSCPLTLTAEGEKFCGWVVNGEEILTKELTLDESYTAANMYIQLKQED